MILVAINDSLKMERTRFSLDKDNFKLIELAFKLNETFGNKCSIKILTTIPGFNKYSHTAFKLSEVLQINKIIYIGGDITTDEEAEDYYIYDLENVIKNENCDVLILVSHYGNVEQLIEKFMPYNFNFSDPEYYVGKAEALAMNLDTHKVIYI